MAALYQTTEMAFPKAARFFLRAAVAGTIRMRHLRSRTRIASIAQTNVEMLVSALRAQSTTTG